MGAATGPAAPQHRRINPVTESSDWRSRRWETTHQRIYDTALALFQEHGFERVNVGQIAAGAGVSVPTFYAHYPSKEHVIMQLPTAHDFAALLAGQPAELALHERIRHAVPLWLSTWTADFREDALARWRIIAATPSPRTRGRSSSAPAGVWWPTRCPPSRAAPYGPRTRSSSTLTCPPTRPPCSPGRTATASTSSSSCSTRPSMPSSSAERRVPDLAP